MPVFRHDLTFQRFGRWFAISYKGNQEWLCRCDCGTIRKVKTDRLRNRTSKSCGCLRKELVSARMGKRDSNLFDSDAEYFWSLVEKGEDCWEWQGAIRNKSGYGAMNLLNGVTKTASRYSWELHFGGIPESLFVCHHCDNPKCVNPKHLFLGSPKDNAHDMIKKGRSGWQTRNWSKLMKDVYKQRNPEAIKNREALKKLQLQKLSISDICEKLGITPSFYYRWSYKTKKLESIFGVITKKVEYNFWRKVNKKGHDTCWDWTGAINASGYGNMGVSGKVKYAHRIMYELVHGSFDEKHVIKHTCGNKTCVNPNHLAIKER